MTPKEIRAAIVLSGTTQSAIARSLGVSANSVARVISKEMRSQRIEAALQTVTGKPVNPEPHKPAGRKKIEWQGASA